MFRMFYLHLTRNVHYVIDWHIVSLLDSEQMRLPLLKVNKFEGLLSCKRELEATFVGKGYFVF